MEEAGKQASAPVGERAPAIQAPARLEGPVSLACRLLR